MREVQLRLYHGGGRWQRPRSFRICASSLGRVGIHVVVDMLLHLRFGREPPPAVRHGAAERPVSLVRPRVLVEDGLLSEIFAALRALVGLFACVDAQVLVQDGPLAEEARAVHTAVRLLVRVDAQMLRQVRLLPKPLAALLAWIRPGFYVNAAVLQQC